MLGFITEFVFHYTEYLFSQQQRDHKRGALHHQLRSAIDTGQSGMEEPSPRGFGGVE